MIELEQPRPAHEVRETRLMRGVHEAAVRRPSIAHEHAREVFAEDRGGLPKPATGPNRIDRRVGGGERPEPVERTRHSPPSLIGADDRTGADLRTQHVVGRGRARRRPSADMDQRAACHAEAEPIAEQRHDVRERQAHPLVQDDDERHGLGAELDGRRAERVRGLEGMPALHAPATRHTRADVHATLAHDGTDDGQIFLVLRGDVRPVDGAPTAGTRDGQRGLMRVINVRRDRARAVAPVGRSRAAARWTAGPLSMRLRERRGLSESGPARGGELMLELFVPTLQPIALTLGAPQRVAQPGDLLLLALDQRVAIRRRRRARLGHAAVMPEPCNLYKYEILQCCPN